MKNKLLNIEFIRVFSIVMVLSIHVANVYIRAFGDVSNLDFGVAVIFSSIARVCVPLFFMIGGIFAVGREYDKKKYWKRIGKFILLLVVWSIIYHLTKKGFSFKNIDRIIVNSFFNADMTSRHLWYMYPLIGIYIALPFIQSMCKNMSCELENLFLGLWFCLSGLSFIYMPLAKEISGISHKIAYPVPLINSAYYLGYFIAGYILYKRFKDVKLSRQKSVLCVAVYALSTALTTALTYFVTVKDGKYFDEATWYKGALVIIASFALFILVVTNGDKFKGAWIEKLSKHTLGIYLFHMIPLNIIKHYFDLTEYNPLVTIPLVTVIVYVSSLLTCAILSRIPVVKKILF